MSIWKGYSPSQLLSFSLITASLVIILAGIYAAQKVLSPVLMASFLAILLLPPLKWLQSKGLSKLWSLIIVILSVLVLGTAAMVILTPQLKEFAEDIPSYQEPLEKTLNNVLNILLPKQNLKIDINFNKILPFLGSHTQNISEIEPSSDLKGEISLTASEQTPNDPKVIETTKDAEKEKADNLLKEVRDSHSKTSQKMVLTSTNELINFLRKMASELSLFASNTFIIMLLVIFMLIEAEQLPAKITAVFFKQVQFSNDRLRKVIIDIRRYMILKTYISLLVGICVTVTLFLAQVRYPLLWGVIAFLLNYVPNIGPVIGAIPPILLAMVDHGMMYGLIIITAMTIIHFGIGYILEPKLLGDGLDLSSLVVLLSLIFSGWLLGPVGMFLSPPIAVICKIILQSFPETRWIAILMANSVPEVNQEQINQQQIKD